MPGSPKRMTKKVRKLEKAAIALYRDALAGMPVNFRLARECKRLGESPPKGFRDTKKTRLWFAATDSIEQTMQQLTALGDFLRGQNGEEETSPLQEERDRIIADRKEDAAEPEEETCD